MWRISPWRGSHTISVLSSEAEMAMLVLLWLWPKIRAVTAARCEESVVRGENWVGAFEYWAAYSKDRSVGSDHSRILASGDPERMWLLFGEMARCVVACRCMGGVVAVWPVASYFVGSAFTACG